MKTLATKIQVVWNGLMRELGLQNGAILVVLVGRINRWKGHGILAEAAELMFQQGIRNV